MKHAELRKLYTIIYDKFMSVVLRKLYVTLLFCEERANLGVASEFNQGEQQAELVKRIQHQQLILH
jgi:hypothetical protein